MNTPFARDIMAQRNLASAVQSKYLLPQATVQARAITEWGLERGEMPKEAWQK